MSIADLWNGAGELLKNIQGILTDFYDFLIVMINFFPSPFKEILLSAIGIIFIIILYKIVKG